MSKKVEKKEKFSLDTRVRMIAANEGGKGVKMPAWFNLPQHKALRQQHIDICKALVNLSEANNHYPITYLVYFAVGKNAHTKETFEDGYTRIDEKKAEKIFSWLKLFAKHHKDAKLARNPNVAHALCAFYERCSTKTKDFTAALELMEKNPKLDVKNAKATMNGLRIPKKGNNVVENEESAAEVAAAETAEVVAEVAAAETAEVVAVAAE